MKNSYTKNLLIFAASLTCLPAFSQHQVSTLAGSSQGFSDGAALSAKFNAPTGLAVSPDGLSVYVADYSGHRIRKINTSTNQVTTVAGTGTAGFANGSSANSQFSYPAGLAVSADGSVLYVADNGNSMIRKIDLNSNMVTTLAGDGNFDHADHADGLMASFNQPTDVEIQGDSVLFVSDTENHVIRRISLGSTAVTTVVGYVGVGGFLDGLGTGAAIWSPASLAISGDGQTLFLADNGNHRIRKIMLANYSVSVLAGDGTQGFADAGALFAQFYAPQGISIDPVNDDIIYVTDTYNHRIRKIDLSANTVSTIAGDGSVPPQSTFANNANGLQAKFFYPTGSAVSPDGENLYVADQGNFKVRKVKTDTQNTTSIPEMAEQQATIFPNPATGKIQVLGMDYELLTLYDCTGKELGSYGKNQEIELSDFQPGIYFAEVLTGGKILRIPDKIVKL
ncbi:MAG: T9SS type A sorting domain-containing protein [Bacteroidota bacterium]